MFFFVATLSYFLFVLFFFFFFNDTATTEIYTLSLHDALPISRSCRAGAHRRGARRAHDARALRARTAAGGRRAAELAVGGGGVRAVAHRCAACARPPRGGARAVRGGEPCGVGARVVPRDRRS